MKRLRLKNKVDYGKLDAGVQDSDEEDAEDMHPADDDAGTRLVVRRPAAPATEPLRPAAANRSGAKGAEMSEQPSGEDILAGTACSLPP